MLKLQLYNFDVVWVPRKYIKAADSLSKVYISNSEETTNDVSYHLDSIINDIPISDNMWEKMRSETSCDEILQNVVLSLKEGKKLLGIFINFVNDLHVVDGVLFRGTQIVVPQSLRSEMLNRIHEGHLGITKCKQRARQCLYWPGISKDTEDMVKKCDLCMKYQYKQAAQPLTQEHQNMPWHKVAADIFSLGNQDYILVIDFFSNYPEVLPKQNKSATSVIKAMKSIFSRHGIPVELTSDNVPFSSYEFVEFADHYCFNYKPISPHHSNSNGKAEKGVQIVKRILKKCLEKHDDPFLALLNYRNTPLQCGQSPAQLLMNRTLKTRLPDAFFEVQNQSKQTLDKIRRTRSQRKFHYDKLTRPLPPLDNGQVVRIFDKAGNDYPRKGMVFEKHSHQSYNVTTEGGKCLRRNRAHLRKKP